MIAGAHHESGGLAANTTMGLLGMARQGKLAGYANFTRYHMIESASSTPGGVRLAHQLSERVEYKACAESDLPMIFTRLHVTSHKCCRFDLCDPEFIVPASA
jgi:hypothetical protein